MSTLSEKMFGSRRASLSCDCRKHSWSSNNVFAIISGVFAVFVVVFLCFSCWAYVHIVELQKEVSKCRCQGPEEKWREEPVKVFAEGGTQIAQPAGQRSLGAWPTTRSDTADEDYRDMYHDDVFDFDGYRSFNSSVNQRKTSRSRRDSDGPNHLDDKSNNSRRRQCRRKGRRQKAQPHVHYEAAEYSVVNVGGTVNFWQLSDWFAPEGCWFVLRKGQVRVKEAGVYWIYAQVTFDDQEDAVRSQVLLGGRGDRPPTPILSCAGDSSNDFDRRIRTCFVAGIKRLDRNDRITVEAWGGVKASPDYTYFGLLKLGI